jgi:hypothetical protein
MSSKPAISSFAISTDGIYRSQQAQVQIEQNSDKKQTDSKTPVESVEKTVKPAGQIEVTHTLGAMMDNL